MKTILISSLAAISLTGCVYKTNAQETASFEQTVAECGSKPVLGRSDILRRVRLQKWRDCQDQISEPEV